MLGKIVIDAVRPSTPTGYPAKAVVAERVAVSADIFRDGHDLLAARVLWRPVDHPDWQAAPLTDLGNDRWHADFEPATVGPHEFVIEAWTDRYATWCHDIELKAAAGDALDTELEEGALLIEHLAPAVPESFRPRLVDAVATLRSTVCSLDVRLNAALDDYLAAQLTGLADSDDLTRSPVHRLWVDRPLARTGAWYEFFPRSEGGLLDSTKRLPALAEMGFDVVYLPPIHPIGQTFRKGRNNTLVAGPDDPGSPWAIGSADGGHLAVAPELGTLADFDAFVAAAEGEGLAVALDYALQCSPDHPWVTAHPEWFHHRPDGTIKYAENPPKKYQDIYPINFWPPSDADREALWRACEEIVEHWIGHGVRIFRVDNPHTKPLAFWDWMIGSVQARHPEVVFLAEAFTRPKTMAKLAEIGFSQSYTYFTWRTTKAELTSYVEELAHGPLADYFRPNFWPNTPDILSGPLRKGSLSAFKLRFVLAATLSPSYGIYSGYELGENQPAAATNEEYLHSEKYELKTRNWQAPGSLAPFITTVNAIRRRHPAFSELRTVRFHGIDNDQLIAYSKTDADRTDFVLVVVNLDPQRWQEGTTSLDLPALGLAPDRPYDVFDELTGQRFRWRGADNYVRLDPTMPAHILHVRPD